MAAISITAASVLPSASATKPVYKLAAGVTVTQGQAVTLDASNNLILADANGVAPANTFLGFALSAGSPGQWIAVDTSDTAYTAGGTLAVGPVYIHTTAGAITQTFADLTSGSTVIIVGVAFSTTQMTVIAGGVTSGSGTT
jgi:hypothetical protein